MAEERELAEAREELLREREAFQRERERWLEKRMKEEEDGLEEGQGIRLKNVSRERPERRQKYRYKIYRTRRTDGTVTHRRVRDRPLAPRERKKEEKAVKRRSCRVMRRRVSQKKSFKAVKLTHLRTRVA